MSHKFVSAVVAAAMAVSLFGASPSFAGSRDRDKVLLGLSAFVLLGAALADSSNKSRRQDHAYTSRPQRQQGHNVQRPRHLDPKPLPQRVRKMTLPQRCMTTVQTRRDTLRYMNERCLQNNYRWVGSLPRACTIKVKGPRGVRTGYQAGCLKRNGYRLNG